jgi:hypothetical protein
MFILILTIWIANTTSSVSVPGFESFEFCQAAARTHTALIKQAELGGRPTAVIGSCVQNKK